MSNVIGSMFRRVQSNWWRGYGIVILMYSFNKCTHVLFSMFSRKQELQACMHAYIILHLIGSACTIGHAEVHIPKMASDSQWEGMQVSKSFLFFEC